MNPTLRYLVKETALRWRTRPSSPLARCVLTFTLTATAGGFLAGFSASAEALRTQLARFGFDTVAVRSISSGVSVDQANAGRLPADHWARPLAGEGHVAVLQNAPLFAMTAWGQPVPVLVASWSVLAELQPVMTEQTAAGNGGKVAVGSDSGTTATRASQPRSESASASDSESGLRAGAEDKPQGAAAETKRAPEAIWLTRNWSAGQTTTLQLNTATGLSAGAIIATARPAQGPWHALMDGDALLVPAEILPTLPEARGNSEIVLFTPNDAGALDGWVATVRDFFAAEGDNSLTIQDPGPLRAALATLEHGQAIWRAVLLGMLGAGVVLVFAAIGVLEQREMRFSQALLRSLGVRSRLLWTANLGENLLLANSALLAALVTVHFSASAILAHLPVFDGSNVARLELPACLYLVGVVNAGVLASLFPLARALKRPIGTLLS